MKNIKYILALILVLGVFSSCEKEDLSYKGPDYVEFTPTRGTGSMQFLNTRYYFHNYNVAPAIGVNEIKFQLIGPHRNKDIEVNYILKEFVYFDIFKNVISGSLPSGVENVDWIKISSTALKGVHYESEQSGSSVIPAGSSFGSFPLNVLFNSDNTNTKNSKVLFIELIDTKDVRANKPTSIYMMCFGKRNSSNPTLF